jgi:hypothetical protein
LHAGWLIGTVCPVPQNPDSPYGLAVLPLSPTQSEARQLAAATTPQARHMLHDVKAMYMQNILHVCSSRRMT